jgi:hypothetical protein
MRLPWRFMLASPKHWRTSSRRLPRTSPSHWRASADREKAASLWGKAAQRSVERSVLALAPGLPLRRRRGWHQKPLIHRPSWGWFSQTGGVGYRAKRGGYR